MHFKLFLIWYSNFNHLIFAIFCWISFHIICLSRIVILRNFITLIFHALHIKFIWFLLSFFLFTLLQFYSIVIIILSLSFQNFIAFFTSLHFTFWLQYFFFFSQYCHLNCLLLLELKFVFHSIIRDYCMLSFKHFLLFFLNFFLFYLFFLFLELSIFINYF